MNAAVLAAARALEEASAADNVIHCMQYESLGLFFLYIVNLLKASCFSFPAISLLTYEQHPSPNPPFS